jgi:hypothetical protein
MATFVQQTTGEQLRTAYALIDELHEMEIRLRETMDAALETLKGDDTE